MVMFTGLWNSSKYLEWQEFNEKRQPPTTIECAYGSTFDQATAPQKPTNWDVDENENDHNNSHNNGISCKNEDDCDFHAGGSTGTSSSAEQELPSLTAAFRSLENRSIIIHCLWYLIIYFTIAVIAYSFVLEKWTIIDSLYFAVATL